MAFDDESPVFWSLAPDKPKAPALVHEYQLIFEPESDPPVERIRSPFSSGFRDHF